LEASAVVALLPGSGTTPDPALGAARTTTWKWDTGEALELSDPSVWPGVAPRSMSELLAAVHPEDRDVLAKVLERTCRRRSSFVHDFRLSSGHWLQLKGAVAQGRDELVVLGTCADTTELRSAKEALARRAASKWGDGWLAVSRDWEVEHLNLAAARFLGSSTGALALESLWSAPYWEDDGILREALETSMQDGTARTFLVKHPGNGWHELRCFVASSGMTIHIRDVRERVALEEARDQADRRQARVRSGLELLSQASSELGAALRRSRVLDTSVSLAVPALADWALVYLEEGGLLRRAAMKHKDPALARVADELLKTAPVPLALDTQLTRTFRSGRLEHAVFNPERDAAMTPHEQAFVTLVRALGEPVEAISVPIRSSGAVRGVLILTSLERAYDPDDLALAQEYANRVGNALSNATRFEREHSTTVALQASLLPSALVKPARADLSALYLPAESDAGVGGDWYDAFELGDGNVGFTVGDITGHGVGAAALMCQMRNSLTAYALEGHAPGAVMEKLDALLSAVGDGDLATAFYGVLDTSTGVLTWSSAGHPPVLVVRSGGVEELGGSQDSMLGLGMGLPHRATRTQLDPMDVVLAYSDGLVERRDEDLETSTGRLVRASSGPWTSDLATRLERVVVEVGQGRVREDDVCALALRWH
jgi:PAS domain-containing protein